TGTTPTLGSIVQNGKLAAAMPALVNALKRVDLPTFGRPTMPHWMPILGTRKWEWRGTRTTGPRRVRSPPVLRGVQALHGLGEVALDRQRQHLERIVDGTPDQDLVVVAGAPQHPGGDAVLVPGVADADPQAVEAAVAQVLHDVAQAVLAA